MTTFYEDQRYDGDAFLHQQNPFARREDTARTSCLRRRCDNASTLAYLAINSGYSMTVALP